MRTKSEFFRAFVAGSTINDGRVITPEMIGEIVDTFDAATSAPRCNVEHILGYSPEPPFNGYGDVVAVKSQTDKITVASKEEKRVAIHCQVEGNDQLVVLAAKDQKPFPSVELTPDYAGTGNIGLVGLAFGRRGQQHDLRRCRRLRLVRIASPAGRKRRVAAVVSFTN